MTNKHNEWLREKIETRINEINKRKERLLKLHDGVYGEGGYERKEELEWVLNELDKMNCDSCKDFKECLSSINYLIGQREITFCSNFEEKK
jgi:hypothetical protein